MTLYIIGLGLATSEDVTLRGLAAIKSCSKIYLENYTSILHVSAEDLSALYSAPVTLATREMVEYHADEILAPCLAGEHVAFLVVGDPVCATTHTDLMIRAREKVCVFGLVALPARLGAKGTTAERWSSWQGGWSGLRALSGTSSPRALFRQDAADGIRQPLARSFRPPPLFSHLGRRASRVGALALLAGVLALSDAPLTPLLRSCAASCISKRAFSKLASPPLPPPSLFPLPPLPPLL